MLLLIFNRILNFRGVLVSSQRLTDKLCFHLNNFNLTRVTVNNYIYVTVKRVTLTVSTNYRQFCL